MSVMSEVRAWAHKHNLLIDPIVEWWKERAAIREYEGNVMRLVAERGALDDDLVLRFAPHEHPTMRAARAREDVIDSE